jgi:hypothetical protein
MKKTQGAHAPQKTERRDGHPGDVENRAPRPPQGGEQGLAEQLRQIREEFTQLRASVRPNENQDPPPDTRDDDAPTGEPQARGEPTPAVVDAQVVLAGFQEVRSALSELSEEFARRMSESDERMTGLEQRQQAPAVVIPGPGSCFDDFAERVVSHPEVQRCLEEGDMPRNLRIGNVPSLLQELDRRIEQRDALGATELGGGVQPMWRPGIIEWMHEEYGLADIINRVPCTSDNYTVVREPEESGHGVVKSILDGAIDGDPTPTNTFDVIDSTGMEVGMWVRVVTATAIYRRRITAVNHTTHALTFATDTINFDAPDASKVVCEQSGVSAESATKPEGYAELGNEDITLKTIATHLIITSQRLWAKPALMNWLRTKLMKRFQRQLSWHLLYGTDSATTLAGFFNVTGLQTYTWSGGEVGDNRCDAFMKAELLIPGAGNVAFAMNKTEWRKLQLQKDKNDNYIHNKFGRFEVVDGGPGRRAIVPYPVVIDNNLIDGDALVIAPAQASELPYNPNAAGFSIGTIDKQFIKNQRTALYEEHLNHPYLSKQAFVKVSMDSAPSS